MARFDPSLLTPPPVIRETKTFTHPTDSRAEWTFSMRFQFGAASDLFLQEQARNLTEQYGPEGAPIIAPGGVPIPMSSRLSYAIAMLMMGEDPNADSGMEGDIRDMMNAEIVFNPPWSVQHWAILAQSAPSVFYDVATWASDLYRQARGPAKNASEAPAAT